MSFFEYLGAIPAYCNRALSGVVLPLFLILAGGILSVRLGFFPYRRRAWRALRRQSSTRGEWSPWRAMSMALSGVALALAAGGAGAILWMWVSALFAAILKFGEITLALRYRRHTERGFFGGAMHYMEEGIGGVRGRRLARIFSALCLFAALSFGSLVQANAVSESFTASFQIPPLFTGVVLAALSAAAIFGGARRIGALTVRLVPLMSLLYILMTLAVIFRYADGVPRVLALILHDAFSVRSAGAGVLGYAALRAMRYGTARGLFSNEAGCGTAPMAHATASTARPAVQGLYGILEVFLDTGVICTLTAFAILLSIGVPTGDTGVRITADALSRVFGSAAAPILSISVLCFAYATVITWAYYGERCCFYLFHSTRAGRVFLAVFCASLILGAIAAPVLVWELADLVVSLMTLINCAVLLYLWKEIRAETDRIQE